MYLSPCPRGGAVGRGRGSTPLYVRPLPIYIIHPCLMVKADVEAPSCSATSSMIWLFIFDVANLGTTMLATQKWRVLFAYLEKHLYFCTPIGLFGKIIHHGLNTGCGRKGVQRWFCFVQFIDVSHSFDFKRGEKSCVYSYLYFSPLAPFPNINCHYRHRQ